MVEELIGPTGKPCPICLTASKWDEQIIDTVGLSVDCHRCGHFKIAWILFQGTDDQDFQFVVEIADEKRHIVSSWIRERTIGEDPIVINGSAFNEAIKALELDFFDKAQRIMLSIRQLHTKVGEAFLFDLSSCTVDDNGIPLNNEINSLIGKCWLRDVDELFYIVERYLTGEVGYLEKPKDEGGIPTATFYSITPKGWDYFNQLERNKESRQGFVAMSFDDKHDRLHDAIWEGIEKAGWEAFSLKRHVHNENITDEIISGIKRARFVVAEFTDNKQNVYYEAGFARGYGLPIVHLVNKKQIKELHFDTAQNLHIGWTDEELESGELTKKLCKHITASIGFGPNYQEAS